MGKKFIHEQFHSLFARMVGKSEDDDAYNIYYPMIAELEGRASSAKEAFRENVDDVDPMRVEKMTWWELFPFLLRPGQVNHEEAAVYMLYRMYSNKNVIYNVSKYLVDALFHTDFDYEFHIEKIPHRTFIVYWGNGDHSVRMNNDTQTLEYTFIDFVSMGDDVYQIRVVYGMKDSEGDDANSGIMTMTVSNGYRVRSGQFLKELEEIEYSELSQMKVPEMYKKNNARVYILLFNFLLYLQAMPEDRATMYPHPEFKRLKNLSNPKKRRRVLKTLEGESPYQYVYIGPKYDAQVRKEVEESKGEEGKKLDHATMVRGHWRHQWYGPREKINDVVVRPGTSQKVIWVQPYWKGEGDRKRTLVYNVR